MTADQATEVSRRIAAADRTMASATGGTRRASQAMLELSRGVEDAAAVYGTMGLVGAVRASSNNLSQFASILSPMAGVVVGLGVALGTVLIPRLFDTEKKAKKLKEEMDSLKTTFDNVRKGIEDAAKAREAFQGVVNIENAAGAGKAMEDQRQQARQLKQQIEDIIKARADLEKNIDTSSLLDQTAWERFATVMKTVPFFNFGDANQLTEEEKKRNATIREELNKLREQQTALEKQLELSKQLRIEASKKELALAKQEEIEKEREARMKREAEQQDKLKAAAEEIRKQIDPAAFERSRIQQEAARREQIIRLDPNLSEELKRDLIEANRLAVDKQLAPQATKFEPATQAALARGSREAINAGIMASLKANSPEKQTAQNTKATAEKIDKLYTAITKAFSGAVQLVEGNF